ncbi:EAL domain-containing response regulator [Kamptonema sp. UHCC 0994]|uniref:EAL domain-containing response regulator n=1 Tax=Kamptonema sp. UHCC 0994 TaxID=3031329 RepID=UPI0023BA1A81|nr:EAL domain-containing response regulator [Kamptonema sp. UHCC 0994]MDF0554836.1 EAL domain-containing response regulator [Kamptonema sp. UHCC 0994]
MTKILVIEDEQLIRETLVELLEAHDFRVSAVENGRIGVKVALSELPDLILCDVQMPDLDGYEVLQSLRQNVITSAIPFIFLTAQSAKAEFRRGMELGADDYLTKPFTKQELLGAIASILSKREAITQPLTQALQQAEARLNDLVNESLITNTISSEKLALEVEICRALAQNEFEVYYQPQVELATGEIISAEALIRWNHPEKGRISPAEFIPLAEETGLIIQMGEWVLLTACTQTASWINSGFINFRVSVNLSVRQLSDPQLLLRIVEILKVTGLEPGNLELEVTESAVMENVSVATATLNELKSLGIRIAIDDFGTGYASLGYLKQFPFNCLKIDKCFVSNVGSDTHNKAITTAVIQLAHNLGLTVIAEGVETEAELDFLREQQCDMIQGYLFSPAKPAAEFELFLMTGKRLSSPSLMSRSSRVVNLLPQSEKEKSNQFLPSDFKSSGFIYK